MILKSAFHFAVHMSLVVIIGVALCQSIKSSFIIDTFVTDA